MTVVLIGNFPPDRQESMQRFTSHLQGQLEEAGLKTAHWQPVAVFSRFSKSTIIGIGKWFGYIDKWLLFPLILLFRRHVKGYNRKHYVFHICDHSNAPYLRWLPKSRTLITCHDVLAIRGAMGHEDAYCPATATGKILQRWILSNLKKARYLTTVSQLTMQQLLELSGYTETTRPTGWQVVYNSFNASFYPMEGPESGRLLANLKLDLHQPYLLHVGSSLPRKNRRLLVELIAQLPDWNGKVYLAGEAMEPALLEQARLAGVKDKIVSLIKPTHAELVALYSRCDAFVFPSFSEGFGWPLIEAQACGAPVIASSLLPMPEVGGDAALYASPYRPGDFAAAFRQLQEPSVRETLVAKGFENCKRFDTGTITRQYLHLYQQMQSA